jgi:hypothetical protein
MICFFLFAVVPCAKPEHIYPVTGENLDHERLSANLRGTKVSTLSREKGEKPKMAAIRST